MSYQVGDWVEAQKFEGSNWYQGRIRALPSGANGVYEVEFSGWPDPASVPPERLRQKLGARSTRAALRDTASRPVEQLDTAPRSSVLSTISRLREKDQVEEQEQRRRSRQQQQQWRRQQQQQQQQDEYQGMAQQQHQEQEMAQQPMEETLLAWQQPTARHGPEEPPTQQRVGYGASTSETLALTVARDTRTAMDELARRLDASEKEWVEKERQWGESLRREEEQRMALAGELEAERQRSAAERESRRDEAHEVQATRALLDDVRSDYQDHKDLFQAAVRPLQEAVPVLQQETASLQEEMNLAADELSMLAESVTDLKSLTGQSDETFQGGIAKLQAESDEQREAIGSLMDLLEKTMTVDDASELHEQLTTEIRDCADNLSARCEEQSQKMVEIEERLGAMADDLMKQIKGVGADAEQEEARLENLIRTSTEEQQVRATAIETTLTAAVERNLARTDVQATELSERLDSSATKLSEALDNMVVQLKTETAAAVETAKDDVIAARNTADQQHKQISTSVDNLGAALRAKMTQVTEEISEKVQAKTDDLRVRVESSVTSLSDEVKSTSTALGMQVRNLTAFVDKETSGIIHRVDEQSTQLRERIEDEKLRVNDVVAKEVRALYERMEMGIGEMDERVSAMDAKLDKTTTELVTSVDEQLKQQDAQMRGLSVQVDETLGQVVKTQEATQLEVQQFVIEVGLDKEITQSSISRVDTKLGDVAHKLTKEIQEHRAHVTKITAESTELIKTKTSELESTVQLHNSRLVNDNADLNEKMLGYNADYDLRLRNMLAKADEIEQAVEMQAKRFTADIETKDSIVQRELDALKTTLPDQLRLLEEKLCAQAATVDQHFERDREHMLELTTELGKRITAKASESASMVRALEEHTKTAAASLDSQLSDKLSHLQVATTDRAIRHDQRLDVLERDATSIQQDVRKVSKSADLMDTGLQNLRRESTEALARLDQQFSARGNTVDERFHAMQERLQESAKDLRSTIMATGSNASLATDQLASKFAASEADLEKSVGSLIEKLSKLEQKSDDNHVQVMQTHRALDEKLSQRCATNESRLANHHQQREADMGDVSTKIEAAAASYDTRLAGFMENIMDEQKNLKVQYDEKHDVHTKAAREASGLIERCQANLTTTCASLEKRFTAKDIALEKQLGDLRHKLQERQQQWAQSHNDLEAAQHEKHMQSEKHAAERWEKLSRTCGDLDKQLHDLSLENKDRQEEIQASIVKSYDELNEQHIKQGENLSAALDAVEKTLNALTEKSTASIEDLEAKSTMLQTKLSAVQSDHQARIEHLTAHSSEKLEQVTTAVHQRATKTEADVSSLAAALESDGRKTSNTLTSLEQRFTETSTAADIALHELNSRLVARLEDVDRRAEEQLQQHEAQLVDARSKVSELELDTSRQISSLDAKSANAVASLEEKSADQHQSHTTGLVDMEAALTAKLQALTKLHSELSETVLNNHTWTNGETNQIKQTIISRSEEETRRVDSQLASVGESIRQLEILSTQKIEGVANQLSEFMSENGATSAQMRTQMSQLETRLSSTVETHGNTIADIRKELSVCVKDLTARSDANDKVHSDLLDRLKKDMDTGMQGLRDQCERVEAAGNTVRQDATAETAKVHVDMQQELSSFRDRVLSKVQETDTKVDDLRRILQDNKRASTDGLSTLTAKLSEHHSSTDMRITNLDSSLAGTTERINLELRDLNDTLSRRVDELHDEVGRNEMQLKRSLDAQESRFDTAIERHDRQLKEQREHFTQVATATAVLVTDTCKGLETMLSETLTGTRAELFEKIEAMGQQVDKNKFELVAMHNELKASIKAQGQQWKEHALELQAKIDVQHNQFSSTTNEIKAEATERDSREALRHETLSGMLEMEVKRVATAQEEQEIRFTSQLAEIRSSTDKIDHKVSTELNVISKDLLARSMSLQEDSTKQAHKLADLEGKNRLEIARIEKTMNSLHRTSGQALDSLSKTASSERVQLERALKEMVGELSRTTQADKQALAESLGSLSASLTASELKLATELEGLGRTLIAGHEGRTARVEEKMTALGNRLDIIDEKDRTVIKVIEALRADFGAGQKASALATETLRLSIDDRINEQGDKHATTCAQLDDFIKSIAANLQAEVGRAQDEEKRQAARAAELMSDLEMLCKEQASAGMACYARHVDCSWHLSDTSLAALCACSPARRDAVREVLGQVSPAIASTQAKLLVTCEKTELKTAMMMVDNDIKDLTEAVKTLAEEVRDEEPARMIDQRLEGLDADVADVSAEVSILSALVESVE
eukprot:COSAG02_NODE_1287_length_13452_cov_16.608403_2_plen_2280_part_00